MSPATAAAAVDAAPPPATAAATTATTPPPATVAATPPPATATQDEAAGVKATVAAARAWEEAARTLKAVAKDVGRPWAGAARAQEAKERVQGAAVQTKESAAHEKIEAMRLKQLYNRTKIEKLRSSN